MNVLVLMAGDSGRFEEAGHVWPKNLIEIDGLPLIERVVGCLRPLLDAGAAGVWGLVVARAIRASRDSESVC